MLKVILSITPYSSLIRVGTSCLAWHSRFHTILIILILIFTRTVWWGNMLFYTSSRSIVTLDRAHQLMSKDARRRICLEDTTALNFFCFAYSISLHEGRSTFITTAYNHWDIKYPRNRRFFDPKLSTPIFGGSKLLSLPFRVPIQKLQVKTTRGSNIRASNLIIAFRT